MDRSIRTLVDSVSPVNRPGSDAVRAHLALEKEAALLRGKLQHRVRLDDAQLCPPGVQRDLCATVEAWLRRPMTDCSSSAAFARFRFALYEQAGDCRGE